MEATAAHEQPAPSQQLFIGLAGLIVIIILAAVLTLQSLSGDAVTLETGDATPAPLTPAPVTSSPAPTQTGTPAPSPDLPASDQPVPTLGPDGLDPTVPGAPDLPQPPPDGESPPEAPTLPSGDQDGGADPEAAEPQPADPAPQNPAPQDPTQENPLTVDPADDPAADTPPPSGEPTLVEGTCLTEIAAPTTALSVTAGACDQPHAGEVFASQALPLGAGAAYPGESSLLEQTRLLCQGPAFAAYVGVDFADSSLLAAPIFPTADTWGAGDRTIACSLSNVDRTPRTESARGSGL